jgi:hypothetical protein
MVVVLVAVVVVVFTGATVVVVVVGNLLSRLAILVWRAFICWLRSSYRSLRVPRVAAARANVIIPNRPIIPNAMNTRILADPSIAINTYLIEKNKFKVLSNSYVSAKGILYKMNTNKIYTALYNRISTTTLSGFTSKTEQ